MRLSVAARVLLFLAVLAEFPIGQNSCRGPLDVYYLTDGSRQTDQDNQVRAGVVGEHNGIKAYIGGFYDKLATGSPWPEGKSQDRLGWYQINDISNTVFGLANEEAAPDPDVAVYPCEDAANAGCTLDYPNWEGAVSDLATDYESEKVRSELINGEAVAEASRCFVVTWLDPRVPSGIVTAGIEQLNNAGCGVIMIVTTGHWSFYNEGTIYPVVTGQKSHINMGHLAAVPDAQLGVEVGSWSGVNGLETFMAGLAKTAPEYCDLDFSTSNDTFFTIIDRFTESIGGIWVAAALLATCIVGLIYFACTRKAYVVDENGNEIDEAPASDFQLSYFKAMLRVEIFIQRNFAALGERVSKSPKKYVFCVSCFGWVIFVVGASALVSGFGQGVLNKNADLWLSTDSEIVRAGEFLSANFPVETFLPTVAVSLLLVDADDPEKATVMTQAHLQEVENIVASITGLGGYDNKTACFPGIFVEDSCRTLNPVDLYDTGEPGEARTTVFANLIDRSYTDTQSARFDHGETIIRTDVLNLNEVEAGRGGLYDTLGKAKAEELGATAYRVSFSRIPGTSELFYKNLKEWKLEDVSPSVSRLKLAGMVIEADLDSEVARANEETPTWLVGLSMGVQFAWVVWVFIRCDGVASRVTLGQTGLYGTGMSIAMGFGLCLTFGAPMHALLIVSPVIVFAIGVDDMFILVHAFDETPPLNPIGSRISETLQNAGLSITMTTITDALAFYIGTFAELPAVSSLSLYTLVCVLCDYFVQVTVFVAFLTMDARRRALGRKDLTWGFYVFSDTEEKADAAIASKAAEAGAAGNMSAYSTGSGWDVSYDGKKGGGEGGHGHEEMDCLSRFFGTVLGPCIVAPGMRLLIVLLFSGATLGLFVAATQLGIGLSVGEVVLSDSPFKEYAAVEARLFGGIPLTGRVHFVIQEEWDYADEDNQRALQKLNKDLGTIGALNTIISWADAMYEYIQLTDPNKIQGGIIDPSDYYNQLNVFLASEPGAGFSQEMKKEGNVISMSKFSMQMAATPIDELGVEVQARVLELIEDSGVPAVAFSVPFAFNEPYLQINATLISNFGLTMIVLFSVTLVFLVHLSAAFIVTVTLFMVTVCVLGVFHLVGVLLNSVTIVILVIALGLSIDYISHVAHGYITAGGDRPDKAVAALALHGSSIMNGATTTMLGVAVLQLTALDVQKDFSTIILIVQAIGLTFGFVFLPSLLSLIGPLSFRNPLTQVLVNNKKAAPNLGMMTQAVDLRRVTGADISAINAKTIAKVNQTARDQAYGLREFRKTGHKRATGRSGFLRSTMVEYTSGLTGGTGASGRMTLAQSDYRMSKMGIMGGMSGDAKNMGFFATNYSSNHDAWSAYGGTASSGDAWSNFSGGTGLATKKSKTKSKKSKGTSSSGSGSSGGRFIGMSSGGGRSSSSGSRSRARSSKGSKSRTRSSSKNSRSRGGSSGSKGSRGSHASSGGSRGSRASSGGSRGR